MKMPEQAVLLFIQKPRPRDHVGPSLESLAYCLSEQGVHLGLQQTRNLVAELSNHVGCDSRMLWPNRRKPKCVPPARQVRGVRDHVIGWRQLGRPSIAVDQPVVLEVAVKVAQQVIDHDTAEHLMGSFHAEPRRLHKNPQHGRVACQRVAVFELRPHSENLGEVLTMNVRRLGAIKAFHSKELPPFSQHEWLVGLDVLQRRQLYLAHVDAGHRRHAHGQLLHLG